MTLAMRLRVVVFVAVSAGCVPTDDGAKPNDHRELTCATGLHNGGDGACVAADGCSSGFVFRDGGRCTPAVQLTGASTSSLGGAITGGGVVLLDPVLLPSTSTCVDNICLTGEVIP
jgi:hypothetical protein